MKRDPCPSAAPCPSWSPDPLCGTRIPPPWDQDVPRGSGHPPMGPAPLSVAHSGDKIVGLQLRQAQSWGVMEVRKRDPHPAALFQGSHALHRSPLSPSSLWAWTPMSSMSPDSIGPDVKPTEPHGPLRFHVPEGTGTMEPQVPMSPDPMSCCPHRPH